MNLGRVRGGFGVTMNHTYHQYYFSSISLKITLLFMVLSIISLLLNLSAYTAQLYRISNSFSDIKPSIYSSLSSQIHQNNVLSLFRNFVGETLPSDQVTELEEEVELKKTLRKAAMEDNKTVIITTLNAAWAEPNSIFDLFLESFRVGNGTQELLKHVVVGAFDRKSYSICMEKNLHCYAMRTDDVDFSGYASFKSEDYLKMIWGRIDFLRTVLQMGYNFVFTDADVMWLRDPFPRFYPNGEFQISCDHSWYNSTDVNNVPNGGFSYVKSNNRTVQFYKFWHSERRHYPGKHDQDVLDVIKSDPFIRGIGLEIRFLKTHYFSGFCEPSWNLDLVVTMHANCCTGLKNKTDDLKSVIEDWKEYTSSLSDVRTNLSTRYWSVPKHCGYF